MKKIAISLLGTVFIVFIFLAILSASAFLTKELDTNYQLVTTWGGRGEGAGKFVFPAGLKVYTDEVYVVDVGAHNIQVFDLEGTYRRVFGKEGVGPGEFNRPWNIYFSYERALCCGVCK